MCVFHSTLPDGVVLVSFQVHLSNKRLGLVTDELDKAATGTVEAALRNLIAYRSSLENRLLARFMDACSQTVRTQNLTISSTDHSS